MGADAWQPFRSLRVPPERTFNIISELMVREMWIGELKVTFPQPLRLAPGTYDAAEIYRMGMARDATVKPQPLPAPPAEDKA